MNFFQQNDFRKNDLSDFANATCRLILERHDFDFEAAHEDTELFFDYFQEHVRNIYELISGLSGYIPLFALYEVTDFFDWQDEGEERLEEYSYACGKKIKSKEELVQMLKEDCIEFYSRKQ